MRNIYLDQTIEIDGVEFYLQAKATVDGYVKEWMEPVEAWGSNSEVMMSEYVPGGVDLEEMNLCGYNASTECFDVEVMEPRIKEKAEEIARAFALEECHGVES